MQIIKTPLNQVNPQSQAELISYVDPSLTDALNPALIFVPGGSYTHIDFKQSEKVALRFLSLGFQVSILRYSFVDEVQPLFPAPLLETAQAIATTKQNAAQWHVDRQKVMLMGFSVGGHVVANYNNLWSSDYFLALQAHQVPTELHLYHHGPHGMALADETTAYDERHQDSRIADWIANALAFLREL